MCSRDLAVVIAVSVGLCGALVWTGDAHAQSQWNRGLVAVAVLPEPGGPGTWTVAPSVKFGLMEPQSTPTDLSTDIDVMVNGTVVATVDMAVTLDSKSQQCDINVCEKTAECGSGMINGESVVLNCLPNNGCCCGIVRSAQVPAIPASTGDEIAVILRPAPGAVPEQDTSDDQLTGVFDGLPIAWNRHIESIDITPSPGAPLGFYDITTEYTVGSTRMDVFVTSATADLSFDGEILVNGVPTATIPEVDFDEWITSGFCFLDCGGLCPVGTACGGDLCMCSTPLGQVTISQIELTVGDEIMVLLHPAPGALPEVLPADDSMMTVLGPSGVDEVYGSPTPSLRLDQNVPNPFNPSTTIAFTTTDAGPVHLDIYDMAGRLVRTLIAGETFGPGEWSLTWDGTSATGRPSPAGVYLYRLTVSGRTETRKMTLIE